MATSTDENSSSLDAKPPLTVLTAFRRGDFSQRMPNDLVGFPGKAADLLNDIIDMAERTTGDVEHVSRAVGKSGSVHARLG